MEQNGTFEIRFSLFFNQIIEVKIEINVTFCICNPHDHENVKVQYISD